MEKLRKLFSARRIIVSQGKEKEKLRKLFSATRVIVSQGEEVEKLGKHFSARDCFSRKRGKVDKKIF